MQKQLETVQGQQHGARREFSLAGMVQVLLSGALVWPRVPSFTISSVAHQRLGWAALAPQVLVFVGNGMGVKVQALGDHMPLVGSQPVPLVPTATPILEQSEPIPVWA